MDLNQFFNTNKLLIRYLCFILIILLSGCANFKDIEVGEIENLRFKGLKDNIIEFEINVPILNPNKFGFKIKEINVKASINNYYLGRLETDDVIIIPAKSNEIHNLKLKLRIANIIQGFSVFFALFKEEKLSIDIEGYIRFKSFLINRKINVKETSIINSFK